MLNCFDKTNLFFNIKKCEFKIMRIKYLKFVIKAEVSIQMNSEKIKAIIEWQSLITVKNV